LTIAPLETQKTLGILKKVTTLKNRSHSCGALCGMTAQKKTACDLNWVIHNPFAAVPKHGDSSTVRFIPYQVPD